MKKILLLLFAACLLQSCRNDQQLVQETDLTTLMKPASYQEAVRQNKAETEFWWKRLETDSSSYINKLEVARQWLAAFRLTGDAILLQRGDSLLWKASEKINHSDPDILFGLAQNSITRHEFQEADQRLQAAIKANGSPYTAFLLQFDVSMELGQYDKARQSLRQIKDQSSFDYLIRSAKWEDHQGKQAVAILQMEKARELVATNKAAWSWVQSNLADMYGHAGRPADAYRAYLDVLKSDPLNLHCLRGVAWIAYAQDSNNTLAGKILRYIQSQKQDPELLLFQAELEEQEGRTGKADALTRQFMAIVAAKQYGEMYNKYLLHCLVQNGLSEEAVRLAEHELKRRFTPETNDWLAWARFKAGDPQAAYQLAKAYVYGRNFEPEALWHTAEIFAATGHTEEARELLAECRASRFELGPATIKKIDQVYMSLE